MGVKVFAQEQCAIKLWGFDTITVRSNVCFLSTKLQTGAYQSVSWPLKWEGLCAAGGIGWSHFLMIPYEEARTSASPSLLQRGRQSARCRSLPRSPDSPQVEGEISLEPRKLVYCGLLRTAFSSMYEQQNTDADPGKRGGLLKLSVLCRTKRCLPRHPGLTCCIPVAFYHAFLFGLRNNRSCEQTQIKNGCFMFGK